MEDFRRRRPLAGRRQWLTEDLRRRTARGGATLPRQAHRPIHLECQGAKKTGKKAYFDSKMLSEVLQTFRKKLSKNARAFLKKISKKRDLLNTLTRY